MFVPPCSSPLKRDISRDLSVDVFWRALPDQQGKTGQMIIDRSKAFVGLAIYALSVFAGLLSDDSFAQAPYYQGKTITIIAGTAPGGIGDNRVKSAELIEWFKVFSGAAPLTSR
jgi:hypothetical protein